MTKRDVTSSGGTTGKHPPKERRSGKDRRSDDGDRRDRFRFEPEVDPRRDGMDRRRGSWNSRPRPQPDDASGESDLSDK